MVAVKVARFAAIRFASFANDGTACDHVHADIGFVTAAPGNSYGSKRAAARTSDIHGEFPFAVDVARPDLESGRAYIWHDRKD